LEVREQYKIKVPDSFLVLGNFDDIGDISRTLENIRTNFRIPTRDCLDQYERKQYKLQFDEER